MSELLEKKYEFERNIRQFQRLMRLKILINIPEKGFSWRNVSKNTLYFILYNYYLTHNWLDVANLAFMLWENEQKEVK